MLQALSRISVIVFLTLILFPQLSFAGPTSTNFELKSYGFGAGGDSLSSTNFKLYGTAGELEMGRLSSTNFKLGSGLTYLLKVNVPPSPTVTNPGTNYDRLLVVINTGSNPTDATFALQISTDSNFLTNINYIKSDNTIGSTLTTSDFQTYANWGGGSGEYVTGLPAGTTYYVRTKARQGTINFTESEWGPATAGVTTSSPSLTFSTSNSSITFSNLNAGNSYTDSSKTTVLTTSTNAYNGYVVNARETGSLTHTVDLTTTIANYASANSSPTSWTGTGFGYTTSDNDLTGGTNTRFSSGTKYAGFTTSSPGDPVADHTGPVLSAISNENFTISYKVTADATKKAGKYTTTILYNVVPEY
jgi:hypothetical protein